ncbi:MAG TPA: GNAT family N-acetyltransferase [Gaiellaceae bacterium]|nr:GNAT family N-acetyltransferase [Gaiellaceae bacterium]
MQLRRAEPSDADAIADVFIASFEQLLNFLPRLHTHEEDRAFIRDLVERHEVWVAEDDGLIVGFAAIADARLEQLYVHPDYQGRGVGTELLAKTKERQPGGFSLWVFQQNDGARRFYEANGLELVELTDGSGNEEKTPDAQYEWSP